MHKDVVHKIIELATVQDRICVLQSCNHGTGSWPTERKLQGAGGSAGRHVSAYLSHRVGGQTGIKKNGQIADMLNGNKK